MASSRSADLIATNAGIGPAVRLLAPMLRFPQRVMRSRFRIKIDLVKNRLTLFRVNFQFGQKMRLLATRTPGKFVLDSIPTTRYGTNQLVGM
jgi:hypothetical protein